MKFIKTTAKRFLVVLLILVMVIPTYALNALAIDIWDGSTGGAGAGNSTKGTYNVHHALTDIAGYRFTVYGKEESGYTKKGHSVDLYLDGWSESATVYSSRAQNDKISLFKAIGATGANIGSIDLDVTELNMTTSNGYSFRHGVLVARNVLPKTDETGTSEFTLTNNPADLVDFCKYDNVDKITALTTINTNGPKNRFIKDEDNNGNGDYLLVEPLLRAMIP